MASGKISIAEGTDKNIAAHSFTEDSETRYVERVAPGSGVLTLPGTAQIAEKTAAGTYPATAIDITGKGRIIIKSDFSTDNGTAKARLQFFDSAGRLMGQSDEYDITNTGIQDSSRYVGNMLAVDNTIGASGIKINVTAVPSSGNVSLYVAGV
jgi:hypothetical protein